MYLNSLHSFRPSRRAFLVIKSFNLPNELIDRYQYSMFQSTEGLRNRLKITQFQTEADRRRAQASPENHRGMLLHLCCSPPVGLCHLLPCQTLLHPSPSLTLPGLPKAPSTSTFKFSLSCHLWQHQHQAFCLRSPVFL